MRPALLRIELLAVHGPECPGCGVSFDAVPPTIDHRVPLSRGGGNGIANLWLLCANCNHDKADLTTDEWSGPRKQACCPHPRGRHQRGLNKQSGACWFEGCDCKQYRSRMSQQRFLRVNA